MIIDELFQSLHERQGDAPDKTTAVYGKQIVASEQQVKTLVTLAHLFPQRLTNALAAIEKGHCAEYECMGKRLWVIELIPVCLSHWICSCKDFEQQLCAHVTESSRWRRTCKHLLAAHILEQRYPIVDFTTVRHVCLSAAQMATVSLDGTSSLASIDDTAREHSDERA